LTRVDILFQYFFGSQLDVNEINYKKNIISFFRNRFLEAINFVVLTEVRQEFLPNGKKSYRFSSQKGDFPYKEKGSIHRILIKIT
jgi:hypothetical protein